MSWRWPRAVWWASLLVGATLSVRLGAVTSERMVVPLVDDQALFGQASEGGSGGGPKTYQRIIKNASARGAQYGFQNFNGDRIELSHQMAEKDFRPYNDAFGYTTEGVAEVKAWRDNAKQGAFKLAVKAGKSQAQLDAAVGNIDKEYDKRLREYLSSRGFKLSKGNIVSADMPAIVRKNGALLKPVSLELERFAVSRKYRSSDIIGAALSFVQTAMHYQQPDASFKEKRTGGLLPPMTAFLIGWGDCDTKTGLLASMLSNWGQMRMVGVSVPEHYLMGVLQMPEKGDLFLEHDGMQFLLLEPAGPAWLPPGQVGETTVALLNGREGYKIEPFY